MNTFRLARAPAAALLAALVLAVGANIGFAAVVGRAISPEGDLGLTTFEVDDDGDNFPSQDRDGDDVNEGFTALGDMFGLGRRGAVSGATPLSAGDPGVDDNAYSISVLDDSLFSSDIAGIIRGGMDGAITDTDPFFAVVDTVNNDTGNTVSSSRTQVATWLFDIAGSSGDLTVTIDMAAMGDFEGGSLLDSYRFDVALDDGPFTDLFISSVDDPANLTQDYTLENPATAVQTLSDPLFMNGTMLSNQFQSFTESVGVATDTLTIRFSGRADANEEAFAFRNIVIKDSEPLGIPGDYNDDGSVDAADFVVWRHANPTDSLPNDPTPGTVDPSDYEVWSASFGQGPNDPSALTTSSAVPEPASMVLLVIGLAGLGGRRRPPDRA